MGDKRIVADVVQTWLDKGENRPTFLFAVDRAHAQNLRDEFETKGVNCGYIDAFSTDDERRDTFRRFRSGRDKIISSVGCLTTGVDEDVRCIIDAAPTRSEIRHVQKIGRGLRMADGKENLRILDHAGNTLRLGMVTDIYHDHLDTRKPGEKGEAYSGDQPAPKPRKCHKCFALIPPGQRVCPKCGEKFLTASTVESVDGELVLLGSGKKAKKQEYTVEQKREWYAALLYLARKRGHKDGAAFHRFIKKFGHEPSGYAHIAKPPSPEIEKWDRSQTIRYLKGKQKAERSAPVEEYHAEF